MKIRELGIYGIVSTTSLRHHVWTLVFLAGLAWHLSSVSAAVIETKDLRLTLDHGHAVRIENRLTGESLRFTPTTTSMAVVRKRQVVPLAPRSVAKSATATDGSVSWTFAASSGESCVTTYAPVPASGDLRISQVAQAKVAGISGVQWGLSGLSDAAVTLVVPALSGVAFTRGRAPFNTLELPWPSQWEAGMIAVQMPRGGFLIWAEDPGLHFKRLTLEHRKNKFNLAFKATNFAPFDKSREARSFPWRITAYKRDWRAGAGGYRRWMTQTLHPTRLDVRRPAWVSRIRFVAITGMDSAMIRELARSVDPTAALLYVPTWRRDGYDKNYPDYTASDKFMPFLEEAHRLGFRVMVHVNYFGCDEKNPLYKQFEPYQLRDPQTDEKLWWVWPRERKADVPPRTKFAYIHPGCTAWRRLLISRFKTLVAKYSVDALHLDQTLCIVNHARGRVDGFTVPEGNLLLHKELRQALPDTALSGEGLDEVTLPFEAFAQRHAGRGVDHVHKTWNDSFIACAHPVSSFLFLPFTTIYGYLGMSNPGNEGLYRAWTRAYEPWGVIPTFARPSIHQLAKPTADALALLEQAGLWTRLQFRPDFSGDWALPVLFRYAGRNGATGEVLRTPGGGSRCVVSDAGQTHELYRYVRGKTRYDGSGCIEGWPAYTQNRALGLPPDVTFLVSPHPPSLRTPHITELPPEAIVRQFRQGKGLFAISLTDSRADHFYDLIEHLDDARTGQLTATGEEQELSSGGSFLAMEAVCGGVRKHSIFAHPPWRGVPGQKVAGSRSTFGEYTVSLPAKRPAELLFSIGLRDGVNGRSDGVTFQVLADGRSLFRRHWAESRWAPCRVDLAAFAGKTIRLRLVTSPGPKHDVSFDWAQWGTPRIRLQPDPAPRRVVYVTPTRVGNALSSNGPLSLADPVVEKGMFRYVASTPIPATLTFLDRLPRPVRFPLDLRKVPFSMSAEVNGRAARLPMRFVAFAPGNGTSHGEERTGFAAHPPNRGRVYADWFLRLPEARKIEFSFAVALQDGSESDGCRFLVLANGRERFNFLTTGPDGWHAGRVDLTEFAGARVLLTLIVDSEGSYSCDWARWAAPVIRAR